MKARVKWIENVCFMGESETGHAVVLDGAPDAGGRNLGMRPMEMLLISMGACSSFDVVTILKKARQPVTDCVAELQAERADELDPARLFHKDELFFQPLGLCFELLRPDCAFRNRLFGLIQQLQSLDQLSALFIKLPAEPRIGV